MEYVLLVIGGVLFAIGEGLSEATTWNMYYNIPGNIVNNLSNKDKTVSYYHTFRLLEIIGFITILLTTLMLYKETRIIATIIDFVFYSLFTNGIYRISFMKERKQNIIKKFSKKDWKFNLFGKIFKIKGLPNKLKWSIFAMSILFIIARIINNFT